MAKPADGAGEGWRRDKGWLRYGNRHVASGISEDLDELVRLLRFAEQVDAAARAKWGESANTSIEVIGNKVIAAITQSKP